MQSTKMSFQSKLLNPIVYLVAAKKQEESIEMENPVLCSSFVPFVLAKLINLIKVGKIDAFLSDCI